MGYGGYIWGMEGIYGVWRVYRGYGGYIPVYAYIYSLPHPHSHFHSLPHPFFYFIFLFFFLFYIYIHSLRLFTFMQPPPTPSPILTLPQIQFLNNFLYSKPHSFRNPNTLFKALHVHPYIHTFNKLHLSLPLLRLYSHLIYKQQLSIYTNTLTPNIDLDLDLLYILTNNKYI